MKRLLIKGGALLSAALLCGMTMMSCSVPPEDDSPDGDTEPAPAVTTPASAEHLSPAERAFALVSAMNKAADNYHSFACDGTMQMAFASEDFSVLADSDMTITATGLHTDQMTYVETLEMEMTMDMWGSEVTASTTTKEGFANGWMFYESLEHVADSDPTSFKLRSPLTAKEYEAHQSFMSTDTPTPSKETCGKATYSVDAVSGRQTAVFSQWTKESLSLFLHALSGFDSLSSGASVTDMEITLCCDEQNLPLSFSLKLIFEEPSAAKTAAASELPRVEISGTFRDWDTATATAVTFDDIYQTVDDLRAIDLFERGVERHMYTNSGQYQLDSSYSMTGSIIDSLNSTENATFSNKDGKFTFEGTTSTDGSTTKLHYSNGTLTYGESDSMECTDEEMRTVFSISALNPFSVDKSSLINIVKGSRANEFIFTMPEDPEAVEFNDYRLVEESYSETLTVRFNDDGELVEYSYRLSYRLVNSENTSDVLTVESTASMTLTLSK